MSSQARLRPIHQLKIYQPSTPKLHSNNTSITQDKVSTDITLTFKQLAFNPRSTSQKHHPKANRTLIAMAEDSAFTQGAIERARRGSMKIITHKPSVSVQTHDMAHLTPSYVPHILAITTKVSRPKAKLSQRSIRHRPIYSGPQVSENPWASSSTG